MRNAGQSDCYSSSHSGRLNDEMLQRERLEQPVNSASFAPSQQEEDLSNYECLAGKAAAAVANPVLLGPILIGRGYEK